MTYENRAFQTSARRRSGRPPLSLTIEHTVVNDETGDATDIEETVRIDPLVDIVRAGAAFGAFGRTLGALNDEGIPAEEKIAALDRETPKVRAAFRELLVPNDRAKWDRVKDGVDITTLGQMIRYVTRELSGMDPTQPTSSSPGSASTGPGSTGGALPAPSIPPTSPSPEP
jgi:hypothetical protein